MPISSPNSLFGLSELMVVIASVLVDRETANELLDFYKLATERDSVAVRLVSSRNVLRFATAYAGLAASWP